MTEIVKECRLCESVGPHTTIIAREMMFGSREEFEYYSCATCNTLQLVTVPDSEELMRYYPPSYYAYNTFAPSGILRWLVTQLDRYRMRIGGRPIGALMASLITDGSDGVRMLGQLALERDARILDVGCGSGALLDRLSRAGFRKLAGADPFIASDTETHQGVPLTKRILGDVVGEFDLIMMNHSLEHVADPVETLKMAYNKLAPGGICLARVPTTSSDAWDTYGADWFQVDAPRHIVIPSRQGMALAADKAGLRVEKIFDDSTLSQFMISEAYRRDIAMTDPKINQMFGFKQKQQWQKSAKQLNSQGRGDQAGFVLRAK